MISMFDDPALRGFCIAAAAVFGAVMGSFLNCAAFRIARDESFLGGRSRCPSCGHELTPVELIPVLSWVLQGGRCRSCGGKVSVRYPLTELGFSLVTALCLLRFQLSAECLRNYIFLCCLFCLSLVDLEVRIIPDGCHLVSAAAWAAALPFLASYGGGPTAGPASYALSRILAAAAFGGGVFLISAYMNRRLGRESMGMGDIKLIAVSGLYLGFVGTLFAVMISCVVGLLFYAARLQSGGRGKEFPFGPSIALAVGGMLLFGEPLVGWYLGLLGI